MTEPSTGRSSSEHSEKRDGAARHSTPVPPVVLQPGDVPGKASRSNPKLKALARQFLGLVKNTLKHYVPSVQECKRILKAVAPVVTAMAIYQSDAIAKQLVTAGFIMTLTSIVAFPFLPRIKYLIHNVELLAVLAFAIPYDMMAMAAAFSVKVDGERFNGSAAAISGTFLILSVWILNTIKAHDLNLTVKCTSYWFN